ncbi:MAG: hypothetical protein IJE62_03420 [Clostridia bacterium]|nr:hypothetical protein [Clostridia bacterium]
METVDQCQRDIESFISIIDEKGEISLNIRVSYLKCLHTIKETFQCVDGRKNKEYQEIEKLAATLIELSQGLSMSNLEVIVHGLIQLSTKLKSIKEKIIVKDE